METKRAQITPRRGVATLLKSVRALIAAKGLTGVKFATQSGVSSPVAHRIIKGSQVTIAVKTEVRLRNWVKENTDAPVKAGWQAVDTPPGDAGKKIFSRVPIPDSVTIEKLETEIAVKDATIASLRDWHRKQQKKITKLKRQRDKLIELL